MYGHLYSPHLHNNDQPSPCGRVRVVWFERRINIDHDSVVNNFACDTNVQKSDLLGYNSMSFNVLASICA